MTLVNLLYIVVRGGVLHEPFVAIINNASAGALLGLFIGYFYVQVLRERDKNRLLELTLTHDFKNKSQVVLGQLSLLKEEVNQGSKKRVDKVLKNMSDLFDLSDKIRLHLKDQYRTHITSLDELRRKVRGIVEEKTKDGIEIFFEDKTKSNTEIMAGPLIEEIILEIIDNAITHGNASKITIRLNEDLEKIKLVISDDGEGIKHKEKIFQKEYTTKTSSHGLGLPLAQKVIKDYNGDIKIHDNEQGGTDVNIYLTKL
ncbi:HAMP domain-containing sensor histidine kinase [Methanonatronarchaeum sp. AMET-Sl]|uniref:sensor histidine kinase n=1 Tax=Methanonatronarchaeum sp. AMET-Sl TaxID=3037654 RepID=UPI00244E5283|nr:HAMP domain-containing sensor histidine kinase [Methanonatronarchaeum sp. AMET-Sl]WGI17968.1 HAMP domain-containing sensor histidine kinase [Methanonatronarchaeum sp. AMET-Sl]